MRCPGTSGIQRLFSYMLLTGLLVFSFLNPSPKFIFFHLTHPKSLVSPKLKSGLLAVGGLEEADTEAGTELASLCLLSCTWLSNYLSPATALACMGAVAELLLSEAASQQEHPRLALVASACLSHWAPFLGWTLQGRAITSLSELSL